MVKCVVLVKLVVIDGQDCNHLHLITLKALSPFFTNMILSFTPSRQVIYRCHLEIWVLIWQKVAIRLHPDKIWMNNIIVYQHIVTNVLPHIVQIQCGQHGVVARECIVFDS